MQGVTHASTGALTGAALALFTHAGTQHYAGTVPVTNRLGHILLFAAVTGGMALLPDADHPQASFANAAGFASHGLSHLIAALFGGHRQGMHSVFGVALAAASTAACSLWYPNHWALGALAAVMALCIAAGLEATGFARHGLPWGCAIAGLAVWAIRPELWMLVAIGMALHIFEDEFSGHGCALAWPFSSRRFGGDGHQPARAAGKRAPARKPAARRPASSRPRTGTPRPRPALTPGSPLTVPDLGVKLTWEAGARCSACICREHRECEDAGCQCTRGKHPLRPGSADGFVVPPELPDEPPF